MIIGVNCCHLSNKTDGAKTRLINFYSLLTKIRTKTRFVFFVPKNLDLKKFKKEFNSDNTIYHKIDIFSYNVTKRFLLGIFFWPLMFRKYNLNYLYIKTSLLSLRIDIKICYIKRKDIF